MYKIVAAVNSMIANERLIEQVRRNNNVCYFVYDKIYKWSIAKNKEDYFLAYYPSEHSLDIIIANSDFEGFDDYVLYTTKEIKTKEAIESFSELYQTVQNKLFKIDDVLDQIIKTAA